MDLQEDSENEQFFVPAMLVIWADSAENAVAKAQVQLDRLPIDSAVGEVSNA